MKFKTIEEFEEHYFPNMCKKYPIRMRVSEEEQVLIKRLRGQIWYKIPKSGNND